MSKSIYGSDIIFDKDFEVLPAGDVSLTEGTGCLVQDIIHRLLTPKGDLFYNPDYGLDIYQYINDEENFLNRIGLIKEVKNTVQKDPRVKFGTVKVDIVGWDLNQLEFKVSFTPVNEKNPVNLLINYDQNNSSAEVV